MTTDVAVDDTPERAPARPKRKRLPLMILGVVVLALGAWSVQRYLYSRHHVSTDNAQVDSHITLIAPRIAAELVPVAPDVMSWLPPRTMA